MRFGRHLAAGLAAVALVLLAPEAFAAEQVEHAGPSWKLLGLQVLNAALLIAILVYFTRRPLRDFLVQRSRGIARSIEQAEESLRASQSELERMRRRIEGFESEAEEMLYAAAERAEGERVRALERAEATAARIREEAQRVADQEIERARQELRDEAAALAVTLAGELIRDSLRPADQKRLVREYTDRVEESN